MQVDRVAAPLGAVVSGVKVQDLGPADWQEINALFCQHRFLAFRGQALSPEEHIAFASLWGDLVRHPYSGMEAYPDIIELRNRGKRGDINQHWHSDMTYNHKPPMLTMLYAHAAPTLGGDTAFANQVLAYEGLSDGLKQTVDQLNAVHSAAGLASVYGENAGEAPRAEHPVVRTHDVTGERALFVCRAFTQRFVGWTRQESQGLLETLYEHSIRPEFQARHQWQAGDLLMWDNRTVLHFAVHDHEDEERVIHRVQVEGPQPA